MNEHQLDKDRVLDFIKAGKAIISVLNEATGAHRTFKVTKPKQGGVFFVRILSNKDHEDERHRWLYVGMITERDRFVLTRKSAVDKGSIEFKSFDWLLNAAKRWKSGSAEYPTVKVFHEGKCGRCGRPLTDPASIERGYGPECVKRIGG